MTEQTRTRSNPSLQFFFIVGAILTILGGVAAAIAYGTERRDYDVLQIAASLQNRTLFVGPDYTWMWVWIVVGALGIVLLIIGIAIRAANPDLVLSDRSRSDPASTLPIN